MLFFGCLTDTFTLLHDIFIRFPLKKIMLKLICISITLAGTIFGYYDCNLF